VPIRPFLNGQTFDPETARLVGIAFETARAAIRRRGDLSDEIIARTIIELAKAGERNVEVLCEAALNVPAGAVSAPNLPPLPASPPSKPDSSFGANRASGRNDFATIPLGLPAWHTILDVIGCLLTNRCQVEKLLLYG
jgi:hypothetical protein